MGGLLVRIEPGRCVGLAATQEASQAVRRPGERAHQHGRQAARAAGRPLVRGDAGRRRPGGVLPLGSVSRGHRGALMRTSRTGETSPRHCTGTPTGARPPVRRGASPAAACRPGTPATAFSRLTGGRDADTLPASKEGGRSGRQDGINGHRAPRGHRGGSRRRARRLLHRRRDRARRGPSRPGRRDGQRERRPRTGWRLAREGPAPSRDRWCRRPRIGGRPPAPGLRQLAPWPSRGPWLDEGTQGRAAIGVSVARPLATKWCTDAPRFSPDPAGLAWSGQNVPSHSRRAVTHLGTGPAQGEGVCTGDGSRTFATARGAPGERRDSRLER